MTAKEIRAQQLAEAERLTQSASLALRRGEVATANEYLGQAAALVKTISPVIK
jgi:phage shock protein A